MYPTLYHALLDLTGVDLPFLRFLNSFGFFVAVAFVMASWTLGLELKRKEGQGLLKATVRRVTVGAPASPTELLVQALTGFVLGWKGIYLVLHGSEVSSDPQGFLLSAQGSVPAGLVVGGALALHLWRTKEKARLKEPRVEEVRMMPHEHAGNITLVAAIWGLLGAKLFHWLENPSEVVAFFRDPSGADLFSGLTMYGGLIVAGAMVIRYFMKNGIPPLHGMDAAAPGLMLAYGVGRIGCQVSGDGDWGIVNTTFMGPGPSWLWQYDYPNNVNGVGIPLIDGRPCFDGYCTVLPETVFPTPLYETLACLLFFGLLWTLRTRVKVAGVLFFIYLTLNGVERLLIEQIRVNVELFPGVTQAELIAVLLILLGVAGILRLRPVRKPEPHGPEETH